MTLTAKEMKAAEKAAFERGISYLQMMENAGRQAFELLLSRRPDIKTAAVFCGSGGCGGDALVLARLLKQKGAEVLIILCCGKPRHQDAVTNFYLAASLDIPMVVGSLLTPEDIDFIRSADAVIDGIYGTGFHGELGLEQEVCCGVINSSNGLKLALDIPSGLECDSGIAAQGTVNANLTVAFHAFKPCHEKVPEICGEIILADIGI